MARMHRPARLLPAALRLCRDAGTGAGNQGDRQPQRRQASRLHSQQRIQHDRRRSPLQRTRRMGDGTHAAGAVSERSRQRARSVHDRSQAGHPLSARVQRWRTGGSVREIANDGWQWRTLNTRPIRFGYLLFAPDQPLLAAMEITAAVVREKFGAFTIDRLELTDPRPDEALVRIVASGMCQTDLHGRDGYYNTPYPAVYGHEGAGVVQAVGNSVTKFAPGDHVVISFPWCGVSPDCRPNLHSHCINGVYPKMRGTRADGSTLMRKGGAPGYSAFLPRTSFSTHTIA